MDFQHTSVLLEECLEGLNIRPDGIYVDGTTGGAGHSSEIAKRLTTGRLYSFDRDPDAIAVASERLAQYPCAELVHANFSTMDAELAKRGASQVDGVLLDLGVSSFQLDTAERGFSYLNDGILDMRMSKSGLSAREMVNTYPAEELARIIRDYGEEKYYYSIAKNIVRQREIQPIETTRQLSEIVNSSMPAKARREKNPSKRTFQAIRIAVNEELDSLSQGLENAFSVLSSGGRLVVITFHSLEDRIVKQFNAKMCQGCICPPDFPICVCNNKPKARLVNKKPILPSEQELAHNRRSQSAKLRILEKF